MVVSADFNREEGKCECLKGLVDWRGEEQKELRLVRRRANERNELRKAVYLRDIFSFFSKREREETMLSWWL